MPPSENARSAPSHGRLVGIGLLLTVLFVLTHSQLFLSGEKTLTHDSRNWFPIFAYLSDGVRDGSLPMWSPYTNTGEPFFYLPTPFRFYDPGTLLTMWAGDKLGFSPLGQYHWDFLRRFVFFAAGAACLMSLFSRHRVTPLFVYATVLFSSLPVVAFRQHGVIYDAYTVPFVLYFFHRLLRRGPRLLDAFFLAYFLATAIANYKCPYALWYVAVYAGACAFLSRKRGAWRGLLGRRTLPAALVAAAVFAAGTGYLLDIAAQRDLIVPTLRMASGTDVTRDVRTAFGSGSHSSLLDLASLLCPGWGLLYFHGGEKLLVSETTYYAGIGTVALALFGLVRSPSRIKWVWALVLLLLASIVHGRHSPVAYLSHHFFPAFPLLRHMEFFHPFLLVTLIWLAGLGADQVLRLFQQERWSAVRKGLVPFAACILFYALLMVVLIQGYLKIADRADLFDQGAFTEIASHFQWFLVLDVAVLCGVLLAASLAAARRLSARGALGGIALLMLLDLTTFQRVLAEKNLSERSEYDLPRPRGHAFAERRLPMPERYVDRDLGSLLEDEYCYLPLYTKRAYARMHERKEYVELAAFSRLRLETSSEKVRDNLFGVATPVLRWTDAVGEMAPEAYLAALKGEGAEGLSRRVVVHDVPERTRRDFAGTLTGPAGAGEGTGSDVRVIEFSPDRLFVEVVSDRPGFLYYADGFHPAWLARVDGESVPVVRANYAYKGVFVGAGRHVASFTFKPRGFIRGLRWFYALHLAAFALGGLALLRWGFGGRRRAPAGGGLRAGLLSFLAGGDKLASWAARCPLRIYIALLFLLILATVDASHTLTHEDQGRDLYCAWQVSQGQLPYRDFQSQYGPLFLGYYAGLFALWGPSILTMHWGFAVLQGTASVFTFLTVRRLFGTAWAFPAAFLHVYFVTVYHTFNHAGATLLLSAWVYLLVRHGQERGALSGRAFALHLGLTWALFLTKFNWGCVSAVGTAGFLLFKWFENGGGRRSFPWGRLFLTGVVVPALGVLPFVALVWSQPVERWLLCFGVATGKGHLAMSYPLSLDAFLASPRALWKGNLGEAVERNRLLVFLLAGCGVVASAASARVFWRRFVRREASSPLLGLLALPLFVLLGHEFVGPRNPATLAYHLSGLYAVLLAGLASRLPSWGSARFPRLSVRNVLAALAVWGTVSLCLDTALKVRANGFYWDHPRARVWYWNSPYGRTMRDVPARLESLSSPGEAVAVIPRGSLYLFIAGRRNPLWLEEMNTQFMPPEEEARTIAELQRARPRFVLETNFTRYIYWKGNNFGEDYARLLAEKVAEGYREIDRVPAGPLWIYGRNVPTFDFNRHQVRFLQRVEGE